MSREKKKKERSRNASLHAHYTTATTCKVSHLEAWQTAQHSSWKGLHQTVGAEVQGLDVAFGRELHAVESAHVLVVPGRVYRGIPPFGDAPHGFWLVPELLELARVHQAHAPLIARQGFDLHHMVLLN